MLLKCYCFSENQLDQNVIKIKEKLPEIELNKYLVINVIKNNFLILFKLPKN